ncbi:hypothetical protein GCM10009000_083790 [Halobacterium noricense]|uniref:Uncharacterized protein n=1 Tax=Haladaptatus pallidirubidus TaxID=1008152 RepID=A0AAV3UQZ3_9EURY
MTGGNEDASDSVTGAPIDFNRLDIIHERFATDERFAQIEVQPEFAPERLVCVYNPRLYLRSVQVARLEIVWFENGNFSIHYHEDHEDGTFDHRWDRHPSEITPHCR